MWTKKNAMDEAARGEGCLGRARDDEPVFIIVGDDCTMPHVVRDWARRVGDMYLSQGKSIPGKVVEASKFASEIEAWQHDNSGTVKIPD